MSFELNIRSLQLKLNQRPILQDIQFDWPESTQVLGLIGANGAGKSSLFRCIMGFERRYLGQITFNQQSLENLVTHQRTALGIAYLAQESWLFEDMNALENLLAIGQLMGLTKLELDSRIDQLLQDFSLARVQKTKAKFLSGGEKRRLEICRILLKNPELIILDEPFAGLDPKTNNEVMQLITQLKEQGHRMILSDHQIERVFHATDSLLLMHDGKVVTQGLAEDIKNNPIAIQSYL